MPASIATPKDVTINIEKHFETTINGILEHIIYVNGQEYKELPLDANVREPDRKKSRPYGSMMETLKTEPEKFLNTTTPNETNIIAINTAPAIIKAFDAFSIF